MVRQRFLDFWNFPPHANKTPLNPAKSRFVSDNRERTPRFNLAETSARETTTGKWPVHSIMEAAPRGDRCARNCVWQPYCMRLTLSFALVSAEAARCRSNVDEMSLR